VSTGRRRAGLPEEEFLGALQPQVYVTDRLVVQPRDEQDTLSFLLSFEAVCENLASACTTSHARSA